MAKLTAAACSLLMLASPFVAFAQQPATVGELIEKGGRKLSDQELTTLLRGSEVKGVSAAFPTATFDVVYKRDGTLDGVLIGARADGRSLQYWGKWSINERGELCTDIQSSAGPNRACTSFFEFGGKYYQANADDKTAPIYLREIKR